MSFVRLSTKYINLERIVFVDVENRPGKFIIHFDNAETYECSGSDLIVLKSALDSK